MIIGGAWNKTSEDGKEFISIAVKEDVLPLIIDNTKFLSLSINEKKEKNEHPDWIFSMNKKKEISY